MNELLACIVGGVILLAYFAVASIAIFAGVYLSWWGMGKTLELWLKYSKD